MSTESVPAYFADFKEENARQHGELSTKIEQVKGDLEVKIEQVRGDLGMRIEHSEAGLLLRMERMQATLIKWVVATMLGGITAVSGLMFTLAYFMQSA